MKYLLIINDVEFHEFTDVVQCKEFATKSGKDYKIYRIDKILLEERNIA